MATFADVLEQNAVLAPLRGVARAAALQDGKLVHLSLRETVYKPRTRIRTVFFPISCVISVVSHMRDGTMIEIGTIGREGMTGIPLLVGMNATANNNFCQVGGTAWQMSLSLFCKLLGSSSKFRESTGRFLQGYLNMLGQQVACNQLHRVHERTARWILMTRDRVDEDTIPLTQEFLSTMLGARRSSVTIAATALQKAGLIRYSRGHITVVDRAGLEEQTCECYAITAKHFADARSLRFHYGRRKNGRRVRAPRLKPGPRA